MHRILALRRFGMALADIGSYLTGTDLPLANLVDRQIAMLTRQIDEASVLRGRLVHLRGTLDEGQEPDPADWLTTLEHMTMYDKYFTQQELEQLPLYTQADKARDKWKALVAEVRGLIDASWRRRIANKDGLRPSLFS